MGAVHTVQAAVLDLKHQFCLPRLRHRNVSPLLFSPSEIPLETAGSFTLVTTNNAVNSLLHTCGSIKRESEVTELAGERVTRPFV